MRNKRKAAQEKRRQQKMFSTLGWGVAGLALLAVIVYLFWGAVQPATGEAVPVMDDFTHVPDGTDPGPYNSDPPTSGKHYASSLPAGFYTPEQAATVPEMPVGYLVHNLEHGYVIFWYNCEAEGVEDCAALQDQIRSVMNRVDNFKVVAFPWASQDEPVVMTSWGRMQRFETFDTGEAQRFVVRNRNKSPEPNAP